METESNMNTIINNDNKCLYLRCFQDALRNYENQANRDGYPSTFFTSLRHKYNKYNRLSELETNLISAEGPEQCNIIIEEHFLKSKRNFFNNHSFNMYFIDELEQCFQNQDWQRFNPKRVEYFEGVLYRGIRNINPEYIFKNGMDEHSSSNSVEIYLSPFNASAGNSCSKLFGPTLAYADPDPNQVRLAGQGWVYMIDYAGDKGFDLVKTHKRRAFTLSRLFLPDYEQEVNIAENIKADQVICAFKIRRYRGEIEKIVYNSRAYQNISQIHLDRIKNLIKGQAYPTAKELLLNEFEAMKDELEFRFSPQ